MTDNCIIWLLVQQSRMGIFICYFRDPTGFLVTVETLAKYSIDILFLYDYNQVFKEYDL